ncbi:MAG: hypothetical protein ACLU22_05115 [Clostridium sp.]
MLQNTGSIRRGKTQNDPARFIHKTSVTGDGEIAEKDVYELDEERIREEAMYDGFYAVVTNLEGDVREIININKRRWEIEENFRIMKTEFESRPVYVQRDDRIKAHFSDLLYQPAGLPPSGEKTGRKIHLQPDIRNTSRNEDDTFK